MANNLAQKFGENVSEPSTLFALSEDDSFFQDINIDQLTPMMQQYLMIKKQYKDCLLFYRMGDFYELFFNDAVVAAKELNIVLTKRGKKNNNEEIPMCGMPFHSYQNYLKRLINAGHKVAICEQVESAQEAKKRGAKHLVKREVLRVVTNGTLIEDEMMESNTYNFLCSITLSKKQDDITVAMVDISTGVFFIETISLLEIANILEKINPSEILLDEVILQHKFARDIMKNYSQITTRIPKEQFDLNNSKEHVKQTLQTKVLESFGDFNDEQWLAAGILFQYIFLAHKNKLPIIKPPKKWHNIPTLKIDATTRTNLEINCSISGNKKISLFQSINQTVTAFGARLLNLYLNNPLIDKNGILCRLDCVEFFKKNITATTEIRNILKETGDIERIIARISLEHGLPKDIFAIGKFLEIFRLIINFINNLNTDSPLPTLLASIMMDENTLAGLEKLIKQAIVNEGNATLKDGGFINYGFDKKLDELNRVKNNTAQIINDLEQKYIKETGIAKLKIKQNNIVGYYIEISNSHVAKMNKDTFFQTQTMVNSSRFSSHELNELDHKIKHANFAALDYEKQILQQIIGKIQLNLTKINLSIELIGRIDIFSSLAYLAHQNNYTRPQISDDENCFVVTKGRHPVIENAMSLLNQNFIANDANMDANSNIMLLTGPNMAGKSTYLRQCAILIIMAQMGSFVPANAFSFSIRDQIFSRIGASDNLAKGLSTFMIEMIETATIINQATDRSFVILDEVGRGTSTYDGVAIAWSVLEHLHNKIKCLCLFATHYHELTELEEQLNSLKCFTMEIKQWQNKINFMYQLIPGKINKSYGIHVAALAGMPKEIINRADNILKELELKKN